MRNHGKSGTRLYSIWESIKRRCLSPKHKSYKNYGGRGIIICSSWKNKFISFHNWAINNGYSDHLTIDRIDNDGDYRPSNCRWATYKQQARNFRKNRLITHDGKTMCLIEWTELTGIPYQLIGRRIDKLKWPIHLALTVKPIKGNKILRKFKQKSYDTI